MSIQAALTVTLALFVAAAAIAIAWQYRRAYLLWRRHCVACGGEPAALNVLKISESLDTAEIDAMMRKGFQTIENAARSTSRLH